MDKKKILEMLDNGEIKELRAKLSEEIYEDELAKSGGSTAKKRYAAMKRYFKYADGYAETTKFPCRNVTVSIHGENRVMNCFCEGRSIVLTPENIGSMEEFNGEKYLDANRIIGDLPYKYEEVDLNAVISQAKAQGYRYKRSELSNYEFRYCWKYQDAYYKIGLLDSAFSIINDGEKAKVYYTDLKSILYIETSVGLAGILPFIPKEHTSLIVIE